ncbi:MAG: hypothetical protein KDE46_00585 [Caldilineaceae bacterium]|nr:hypothetical protein [Caldilineaceae bacterium]
MEIRLEIQSNEEDLFSLVDTHLYVPEGVSISTKGPIVNRDINVVPFLYAITIGVTSGVPATLIANWIGTYISTNLKTRSESITIIIDGKGLKITKEDYELIVDEIKVQLIKNKKL